MLIYPFIISLLSFSLLFAMWCNIAVYNMDASMFPDQMKDGYIVLAVWHSVFGGIAVKLGTYD